MKSPLKNSFFFELAAVVVLAILSVLVSTTLSQSKKILSEQHRVDSRINGVYADHWTKAEFHIADHLYSACAARLELEFESWRPGTSGPAALRIQNDSEHLQLLLTPERRIIELSRRCDFSAWIVGSGFGIRAIVENPFVSIDPKTRHERSLGTRLKSVRIIPRHGLLVPGGFSFAASTLLLLTIYLLLLRTVRRLTLTKRLGLITVAVIASVAMLSINSLEVWPRAIPLWGFVVLLVAGRELYRTFSSGVLPGLEAAQRNFFLLGGVGLTIFGFIIRYMGLDFGLPQLFHPDESGKGQIVLRMLTSGDLNPHYFRHPSFLLYGALLLTYLKQLLGIEPSLSSAILSGRTISMLLGTLSIPALYFIGNRLFSRRVGLFAAAALAVSPLHITCSRYMKEDAASLFFALLCLYFALLAFSKRNLLFATLAGLAAGVSASTKYSGALCLGFFPLIAAIALISTRLQRDRHEGSTVDLNGLLPGLVSFGLGFIAGFVLITPFSVLDTQAFLTDLLEEKQHMDTGHGVPISAMAYYWMFHLKNSLLPGLGFPVLIAALLGLGALTAQRSFSAMLLGSLFLLFYLPAEWVKAKPEPQPERYVLPCVPFLCISAGIIVELAWTQLKKSRGSNAFAAVGLALTTALILFVPAGISLKQARAIQNDTRTQAVEWIVENIPKQSTIVLDWKHYSGSVSAQDYRLLELKRNKALAKRISVEELAAVHADYFVLSSFTWERYFKEPYRYHPLKKKYEKLLQSLEPIKVFKSDSGSYGFHNPTILIFSLSRSPAPR